MDLDALREQLSNWERTGVKGPVYEAARAVLDSEEAWWCETHKASVSEAGVCLLKLRLGQRPESRCVLVRVRLLAEEKL